MVSTEKRSEHVFLIAEAGVNHNGDLSLAKKLVDTAVAAGTDAVKFQTFRAEAVICRGTAKADYQCLNTGAKESQLDMVRRLELSPAAHRELFDYCMESGIKYLSTPFDIPSADLLCSFGVDTIKIASGEVTNLPFLRHIGGLGRKVILSTGMADMDECKRAIEILKDAGTPREQIVALQCTTEYPAPFKDVNLRAMNSIRRELGVRVGLSDHTPGVAVSFAAAAMGAVIIEKHFTLDKNMPGPDHKASLDISELKVWVAGVRQIEAALGDGIKHAAPSEIKNRALVRRSIVASRPIASGEPFSSDNITVKRPATGLSPMQWDKIIGRRARRSYAADEPLSPGEVSE